MWLVMYNYVESIPHFSKKVNILNKNVPGRLVAAFRG